MVRQTRNYVDNVLRDLRKGIGEIEDASRLDSLENLIAHIRAVEKECNLMIETIQVIEGQQVLEV